MLKQSILLLAFICYSIAGWAVSWKGQSFNFPNGPKEWSDPITYEIRSEKMEKKGDAAVKVEIRVRAVKKIAMGCRYELEITNKDTRGIRFGVHNMSNKLSYKLKEGASKTGVIDSFTRGCKGIESCGDCACDFYIDDISLMK